MADETKDQAPDLSALAEALMVPAYTEPSAEQKKKLKDWFFDAIEEFYKQKQYLAAEATRLGVPRFNYPSEPIDQAGIVWEQSYSRFAFVFNERFFDGLTFEEFCFVVAHEALHIINSHIFTFRDRIKEMQDLKRGQTQEQKNEAIGKFCERFNVAADCVVNDSLVNWYGFKPIMEGQIYYGKPTIGRDCEDLSVMDVYYLLPDKQNNEGRRNHIWKTFLDSNGNLKREFVKQMKEFIERNMRNSMFSDKESSRIKEMVKDFKECQDPIAAGNAPVGRDRPIAEDQLVSISWNKLLYDWTEASKMEDKWNRVPKTLITVYPDTILPLHAPKETEEIFIAIDASGSISYDALSVFIGIVKNAPRHIKIRSISFDTQCYKYDIKGKDRPQGGGGTSFAIVEEYIKANFKKYPRGVLVLTDGFGDHVSPQYKDRWCWILYGNYSTAYCKDMRWFKIEDLLT
jgi:predicted metal-dependent peptidase